MAKIIQPSFSKGVIAPELYGRVDTAAYQVALAKATNTIIHTYGGVSNRTGLEFIGPIKNHNEVPRIIPFQFRTADSYILEFGNQYMRVVRNDVYVTEPDVSISNVTQASTAIVTANGHGYSDGDEVNISGVNGMTELNGRRFIATITTTNTFGLADQITGSAVNSTNFNAYTGGGVCSKIYEISTPYALADLEDLKYVQSADVMTLTHRNYRAYDLSRLANDNWTLVPIAFVPNVDAPTGLVVNNNTVGTDTYTWKVTAVDVDGQESLPATFGLGSVNLLAATNTNPVRCTFGSISFGDGDEIVINGAGGMTELNGRRFIAANRAINSPVMGQSQVDLLGVDGTNFNTYTSGGQALGAYLRSGIVADPPDATLSWASVPAAAKYFIYQRPETTGVWEFIGESQRSDFKVTAVDGDRSKTFPQFSDPFTLPNENPGTSSYFEQRQVFSGSLNKPDTVFYSRVGERNNFSAEEPAGAADAFSTTLASLEVNEVRHLIPLNDLVVLTSSSEWRVNPGPDTAFELSTIRQKPQSNWGASHLEAFIVGSTIFYIDPGHSRVRTIGYSFQIDGYTGTDISLLANHYFQENTIEDWSIQYSPETRFYYCRDDGIALTTTFDREQEVIAWSDWKTDGEFLRTTSIKGSNRQLEDNIYFVVRRIVNGNTVLYLERLHPIFEEDRTSENAFFVDSGLSLDIPVTITGISTANPVVVTAPSHEFSNGDEVDIDEVVWVPNVDLNFGESQPIQAVGRYKIKGVTTNTFQLTNLNDENIDGSNWNAYFSGGKVRRAVDTVSGLHHLEGRTLVANADGNVIRDLTVSNGTVTFARKFSRIHIGIPYVTDIETLDIEPPNTTIQGNLKKITNLTIKFNRSRGLLYGPNFENMSEWKQRENERYGEPTRLFTGSERVVLKPNWQSQGRIAIRQKDPMPITILSIVPDIEVSDV